MSVNGASTISSCASWKNYVQFGCSDPFNRYWQPLLAKSQRHAICRILGTSINRAPMIFGFATSVFYFSIGCKHSFLRSWSSLLAKTTVTCCLPHPENEHQRSVNHFSCCIFDYQGTVRILAFIMKLLTALIGKNTIYQR